MTTENRKIILYLVVSFEIVSLVSLISISIYRFLMVVYPIKHRILMKGESYCPVSSSNLDLRLFPVWKNISLWPAEQNPYLQRWCDYYHNIDSHLRRHLSQIEKTVEEHSTTKLKRKSRTRETNAERK